jgi:hypothetical protein
MELPDLSGWNAGAEHDEDMFNAVSYAFNFLLDPPECRVNQTSVQSIPTGTTTATAITFQSASVDNDGMWDGAHNTYITIQTPGWYEVEFAVAWATKTTDTTLRGHGLYVNGAFTFATSVFAYNEIVNDSTTTPQPSMSYDMFLNTGDQLSLGVIQGSGAGLNTASSASVKDQQTFLRIRWASL